MSWLATWFRRWYFCFFILLFYFLLFLVRSSHQVINHSTEKVLYVCSCLRRYLNVLVRLFLWNLTCHLPNFRRYLLFEIALVSYNVNFYVISSGLSHEINPFVKTLSRTHRGQVKNYQSHMCIFQVTWNQTFESLLSCSIPKLKSDHFSWDCDVFGYEIDSNCGIFCGIKLVTNVSRNDRAFTYALISN